MDGTEELPLLEVVELTPPVAGMRYGITIGKRKTCIAMFGTKGMADALAKDMNRGRTPQEARS
jgi:hypothetical protein